MSWGRIVAFKSCIKIIEPAYKFWYGHFIWWGIYFGFPNIIQIRLKSNVLLMKIHLKEVFT